jgi:Leucine-rich repeat (LRR) protein
MKKQKKFKFALAILVVSLFFIGVFAQETMLISEQDSGEDSEQDSEQDSGQISIEEIDSSLDESVGMFKIAVKKMDIWMTRNQELKIKKELDLAKLRLIQARVAARNNNTNAMEKALESHQKIIEKIEARMNNLELGVGNSDSEDVEKSVGLERAVEVHRLRIERINQLLENENLSENQKTRLQASIENAEKVIERLELIQERNMAQIRERIRNNSELSEEEANQLINRIEEHRQVREMRQISEEVLEQNPELVRIAEMEIERRQQEIERRQREIELGRMQTEVIDGSELE